MQPSKKNVNIVVLDAHAANPGDLSWDDLSQLGRLTLYDRTRPEEVAARAADAHVVLTNKVVLDEGQLSRLPHLRYIGVLATGYNVVDVEAARRRGIVVTNIPAYSTASVAQLVFAHLLNVVNRVDHYARQFHHGRWSQSSDFCYWDTPLTELAGKTLGVVGLGNIGMRVALIARQFGMDVFAVTGKQLADLPAGIQKTTLEGLFATSDVLTLHCPLTDQTRHMVNAQTLALMRPGAIVVNTGRGPLVDEVAMAAALREGRLAAYCADVLEQEPPSTSNPLVGCPGVYVTPHIAWATMEARARLMQVAVDNVRAWLEGTPQNVVS